MIAVFSSKLFFRAVLMFNAFMVLVPVFFLFNSALRETNSFASNPFALGFDATMVWGPVAGRMVYTGLRYKIN